MNNKLYKLMNWPRIEAIIYSEESKPHEILGPHIVGLNVLFQTFWPGASEVKLVYENGKKQCPMEMVDEAGFFACLLPGKIPSHYQYAVTYQKGTTFYAEDAYRYYMDLSKKDIDKFNAGIHYTIYDKLGAHPVTCDGVQGTFFAVWAPNAIRVSVVGDFNQWDGRIHQMNLNSDGGIYELFIPGVLPGNCYKYEVKTKGGRTFVKVDPYAFGSQLRPNTASVVREMDYVWGDEAWLKRRKCNQQMDAPINIYEFNLAAFKRNAETNEYRTYTEIAPLVVEYVKSMGYTHIELMPIMEHSDDTSLGYQVTGYYAPTARYGTAEDFMFFIDTLHQAEIGVILDWVPAHFPKYEQGMAEFDGTCLYEHLDPRKGIHPKWGTLLYNYERSQVSNYLIANALYWVERFHADGIRMDSVASMLYLDYDKKEGEWIANLYGGNENLEAIELIKHLNSIMKKRNPGVLMIAEDDSAYPRITGDLNAEGLGFDLKWNKGCIRDFLSYLSYDPYFRSYHHSELTFSMIYAYSEKYILPLSHDEVTCDKTTYEEQMPGNATEQFANLRVMYAYLMLHPGKKMLFGGHDIEESDEVEANRGINQLIKALNFLYREKKALHILDTVSDGFEWLNDIASNRCMVSFLRKTADVKDTLVVVANFANVEQEFVIGVPYSGKYKEILNTDALSFGGQGRINSRAKTTSESEADGRPFSFKMNAAPLSVSVFSYMPYTKKEEGNIARRKEQKAARLRAKEARRIAEIAQLDAKEARQRAIEAEKIAQEAMEKAREAERLADEEMKK